jgi:hypothetical protein
LESIIENDSECESALSKCTATGLLATMFKFETGIFANLWNTILGAQFAEFERHGKKNFRK